MAEREKLWVEDGRIIVTTDWLCKVLPTTRKTLTEWGKNGIPKKGPGKWDFVDVLAWLGHIGAEGSADREAVSLKQQKLRKELEIKTEQAELARFRNEQNAKKYVERTEVERNLAEFFIVFKKSALMIPRRVAGELSHVIGVAEASELEGRLMDIVGGALSQMSMDGAYDGK
ncbi:hypothetical protein ACH6CV_14515 [Bacillota bacterium Meth-B3]